jgi:hypothetical protein
MPADWQMSRGRSAPSAGTDIVESVAPINLALHFTYGAVNAAFADVANDLSAYATSSDQVAIEARRVFAAGEALRLAELRFRAGVTGFL